MSKKDKKSSFKMREPEAIVDQEYEIRNLLRNGVMLEVIYPIDKKREVSNTPHLVIMKVPIKTPSGSIQTVRLPMPTTNIKEIWLNVPNADAAKAFAKKMLAPGIATPGDGGLLLP